MTKKIIKTVATRCHILRLKCCKFYFGWGSTPDPDGEAHSTPRLPSWISRILLLRERRGEKKRKERDGKRGKKRKGEG